MLAAEVSAWLKLPVNAGACSSSKPSSAIWSIKGAKRAEVACIGREDLQLVLGALRRELPVEAALGEMEPLPLRAVVENLKGAEGVKGFAGLDRPIRTDGGPAEQQGVFRIVAGRGLPPDSAWPLIPNRDRG